MKNFTETLPYSAKNKKGNLIEGEVRFYVNPSQGRITKIELSENLRREAGLNSGHLRKVVRQPDFDLDDLIELANDHGACMKGCQDQWLETLNDNCLGLVDHGLDCLDVANENKTQCRRDCWTGTLFSLWPF